MSRSFYALLIAVPVPLAGCADSQAPPIIERAAISAAQPPVAGATYEFSTGTVYYSGDPARGHKPDGTFRRGTRVSLLHRAGTYSVVRSPDGLEAYVATHTLAPLEMP